MAAVGQTVTPSGLTGDGFVLALRDSRRGAVRFWTVMRQWTGLGQISYRPSQSQKDRRKRKRKNLRDSLGVGEDDPVCVAMVSDPSVGC